MQKYKRERLWLSRKTGIAFPTVASMTIENMYMQRQSRKQMNSMR